MKPSAGKQYDIATFDFDDTLLCSRPDPQWGWVDGSPNYIMIDVLREMVAWGTTVYIVTSRREFWEDNDPYSEDHPARRTSIKDFVRKMKLPVAGIFFTNGRFKVDKLLDLRTEIHFDDNLDELEKIARFSKIKAVHVKHCDL